jgi:hypothetical protein
LILERCMKSLLYLDWLTEYWVILASRSRLMCLPQPFVSTLKNKFSEYVCLIQKI